MPRCSVFYHKHMKCVHNGDDTVSISPSSEHIVARKPQYTDLMYFVRFSRDDKMARATLTATGNTIRKDSATWTANSGSVGDVSNNAYIDIVIPP